MNDRELLEQVEVVGYLYAVCDDLLLDHQKPNLPNEPLMTVAQHKRILAAQPQSDQDYIHLCAALYQACGAYDMPERVLDALSAAANAQPFIHLVDGILPCMPDEN